MDRRLLNRLKFHLAKLVERPAGPESVEDWTRVVEALDELAGQAADEQTASAAKALAKDEELLRARRLPGDVQRLLIELGHATRRNDDAPPSARSVEQLVASALRGRTLVVIGGDPRGQHRERLIEAFGLGDLHWPVTRENAPDVSALEPVVSRSEVAAVVLLIRFIRHALNDVAALCERHGKPLARVTAGYNPAQVAAALHEQCGRRLGI